MKLRNKLFLAAVLGALGISCSSTPKEERVQVKELFVGPIRYRRPVVPSISPKESPGSVDYQRAQSVDDTAMECRSIDQLLTAVLIKKTETCFKSQKTPLNLKFQLLRHTEPEWILQTEEETPDCWVDAVSHLPLPREVFFLANHQESLSCVNSRIPVEQDETLGAVLSETETVMKIHLEPKEFPKSQTEVSRLLRSWVLSPFFAKDRSLSAKLVPKRMCQACFQDENILKMDTRELPKWP